MGWDGDDLAGKMEEVFERQQAAADARAHRGTSSVEERARSAKFESLRLSRSRIMGQLSRATNPAHRSMLEKALQSINDQMVD
jgi:hypothetical protein